jgi:hypothetical protein
VGVPELHWPCRASTDAFGTKYQKKSKCREYKRADADPWPSPLHGHEYDKGLKLDAITGRIFDVATRQLCETLNPKHLRSIQDELRASKDFKELVLKWVDVASDTS